MYRVCLGDPQTRGMQFTTPIHLVHYMRRKKMLCIHLIQNYVNIYNNKQETDVQTV